MRMSAGSHHNLTQIAPLARDGWTGFARAALKALKSRPTRRRCRPLELKLGSLPGDEDPGLFWTGLPMNAPRKKAPLPSKALPAMSVREVAGYLNVDEKTIYRLVQRRELPSFKV